MYIFTSATKTIPTYVNSCFLALPPVQKCVTPWKVNIIFNFFSSKITSNKSHKTSGSYHTSSRLIWFNFKFAGAKMTPRLKVLKQYETTHLFKRSIKSENEPLLYKIIIYIHFGNNQLHSKASDSRSLMHIQKCYCLWPINLRQELCWRA